MVYRTLYLTQNFPTVGGWQVQPPAVFVTPPPLHFHLRRYLGNTAVCLPPQLIAQPSTGEMLHWFHHGVYLPEHVWWPAFVKQHPASCYVIDLPTAAAARDLHGDRWFVLRYGTEVHQFLA